MPSLKDATGQEWLIEFDGLLLGEVRSECGIDLADPTGSGYVQIALDAVSLVRVLKVLLRESIPERMKDRDFSKRFRKQALTDAVAAIWGAAENFFPENLWSVLQSSYPHLKTQAEANQRMRPILALMETMPPAMRAAALARLVEEMGSGDSPESEESPTPTDSTDETRLTPASITPESPESIRAA